jgi:hypothetical protein
LRHLETHAASIANLLVVVARSGHQGGESGGNVKGGVIGEPD